MKLKELVRPFKSVNSFITGGIIGGMAISFLFNDSGSFLNFFISTLWSFIIWVTQWLGHAYLAHLITSKFPWERYKWKTIVIRVFTIMFYSLFAFFVVQWGLLRLVQGPVSIEVVWKMVATFPYVLAISFFVTTVLATLAFSSHWKKTVLEHEKIKAEMMTYKYDSLRNQINPHFLFNSLNVLSDLVIEDQKLAVKFIRQLSLLYRYVLDSSQKELISVQEEFTFIESYKFLLETRFEKGLEIQLPEQSNNRWVVPLSVQLLLENAVKHNVVSSSKPLTISIYEKDGYLWVENNVNPKETLGKSTKVGLQNITDRYGLISHKNVEIIKNNNTFTVRLPLLQNIEIMTTTNTDFENNKYIRAVERVGKIKEFYQNIITYLIMIPVFIFINLRFSPQFHWFWFPMFGWGIGVLFHGLEAYNYSFFLGRNWEEKKIKEMMGDE